MKASLIVYSGLVPMSPKTTPIAPTTSPNRPMPPWPCEGDPWAWDGWGLVCDMS